MSELKTCPFCGCRVNVWTNVFGRGTVVYVCSNKSCGADVMFFAGDKKGKAENNVLWNRRAINYPTCTIVSEIFFDDYDEYEVELSCGDSIRWVGTAKDLAFCSICGAKVVK